MTVDQSALDALYPSMAKQEPTPAKPAPQTFADAADRVFGGSMVTQAEQGLGVTEKMPLVNKDGYVSPWGPSGRAHVSDSDLAHFHEGPPPPQQQGQREAQGQARAPQQQGQAVDVETLQLDELSAAPVSEMAADLGLDQDQLEAVISHYDQYIANQAAQWEQESREQFTERDIAYAVRAMQEVATPELVASSKARAWAIIQS